MTQAPSPTKPLPIDLALQGGGAHGAFTWGVLDRLLQDETLEIAAISGTSAGAMNAVALAAGLMEGGREGARKPLRAFWTQVGAQSPFALLQPAMGGFSAWTARLPGVQAWQQASQESMRWWSKAIGQPFSPYQFNPLDLNPLRSILERTVDFERVRACTKTQLFIAATHVRTGALRVFRQHELSAKVALASACLPTLFQAVEIDGEAYWDGGYAGNPSLMPLISESPADDLLLVQINPMLRSQVPQQVADIMDRVGEITFNASLLKELRTVQLLKNLIEQDGPAATHPGRDPLMARIAALRTHRIDGGAALVELGAASKLRTDPPFLLDLYARGHSVADAWLQAHRADMGQRATLDLRRECGLVGDCDTL